MQECDSDHFKNSAPQFIISIGPSQNRNNVIIEIEDNGPGIDEQTRKRIFEPFFTTKPPDRGTGLGLSVSYFIIARAHNGNMTVESTLGLGTKFIIELPVGNKS